MAALPSKATVERERRALNGWLGLLLLVVWFVVVAAFFGSTVVGAEEGALAAPAVAFRMLAVAIMIALGIFACFGFFTLEPNEARVLILFGAYKGTIRNSGFHWANPLYARNRGPAPNSPPVPTAKKLLEGATGAARETPRARAARRSTPK